MENKQDAWNSLFKAFHEPSLLCTIVLHCIENFKHILHLTIYFVIHIFSAMNRMLFLFCLALVLKFINEVSIGCCWEPPVCIYKMFFLWIKLLSSYQNDLYYAVNFKWFKRSSIKFYMNLISIDIDNPILGDNCTRKGFIACVDFGTCFWDANSSKHHIGISRRITHTSFNGYCNIIFVWKSIPT